MRKSDKILAKQIEISLQNFEREVHILPGIDGDDERQCLIEQIIDSTRRIKYVTTISNLQMTAVVANPDTKLFDPLKAAIWHKQNQNLEESFWLVFLATHFGKNKKTEWELIRNIYKGDQFNWTWNKIVSEIREFRNWLEVRNDFLKSKGNFSNHRKYESLSGVKSNGTGEAIESYVNWVRGSHEIYLREINEENEFSPRDLFEKLYNSMSCVSRFGRTGKFDYLTMLGKLGLANVEPPSTYMVGATGPVRGANLLFVGKNGNDKSNRELEELLNKLEGSLDLYFGMQVLEDSLCNWQKNPSKYIHFTG